MGWSVRRVDRARVEWKWDGVLSEEEGRGREERGMHGRLRGRKDGVWALRTVRTV